MLRARLKHRAIALACALLVGAPIAIGAAPAGAGEPVLDPFVVRAERERAAGPFHPVRGPADYGDAEAAFGNARGRAHEGQDIFAPAGTPLLAPAAGRVTEIGSDGGRGNWIAIYDPERGRSYIYLHLLEPAGVDAGERVEAGHQIGRLGCTGSCYGDHLHFEIRDGRGPYGSPIDPAQALRRWDRKPR